MEKSLGGRSIKKVSGKPSQGEGKKEEKEEALAQQVLDERKAIWQKVADAESETSFSASAALMVSLRRRRHKETFFPRAYLLAAPRYSGSERRKDAGSRLKTDRCGGN